jgi:hypothetical protein
MIYGSMKNSRKNSCTKEGNKWHFLKRVTNVKNSILKRDLPQNVRTAEIKIKSNAQFEQIAT